jgi:hypothetical protein
MNNEFWEFLIPNVNGKGGLLFFDRQPFDPAQPIEYFSVRVTDHDLDATAKVYAGYFPPHLARLFARMAQHWSGWSGELNWESLEGELKLQCSHDGLGHITIGIVLRSGPYPQDWQVESSVVTEAGQLDSIAKRAELFFGKEAYRTE